MSDLLATANIQLLAEQEQQVAMLGHLASYSDMLIAVVGPEGSGKTSLAFELLKQHNNIDDTLYVAADIMFGIPSLLRRIGDVDQLQLPENRGQTIDLLKAYAEQRAAAGRSLLVVIDQAEQLDVDTLNEVAHLALLIPQGLSFILFGVTGFEQQFRRGPAQAAVHVQPLMPLTEDGAQMLLQQIYSPNQPLPLSQTEFIYLYRESGGWPGHLLMQAAEYFIDAEDAPKRAGTNKKVASLSGWAERFPLTHVLALALLAIALLLSYWYQPTDKSEENIDITNQPQERNAGVEDVLRGLPLPEPVLETTEAKLFQEEAIEQQPELELELEPAPKQEPEIDYNYQEPVKAAASPAPKVAKVAATDADKLLAIKTGAVAQLFGSYEKANADKFVQQWQPHLEQKLYQYQTQNRGKAWHVVVAAGFKSKTDAQQAIQKWPHKLRADRPWVRDIKDVHSALK